MEIKPQWMGMARLTTNQQYGDQDEIGDRTLGVWMGRGYYYFSSYNTQPE
jgi:hypothetical protein